MSGDTLWAWQVQEPDGSWSMVGALMPELGVHMPLVHRSRDVAGHMSGPAHAHATRTGQKLRLAEFSLKNQWQEN